MNLYEYHNSVQNFKTILYLVFTFLIAFVEDYYIGHSLSAMVACFSRNAELASKVPLLIAISPVTRVTNLRGILAVGADFYKPLLVRI